MKRIGLTQRVDCIESYGERRDALDQKWYSLLLDFNALPIPLPNIESGKIADLVDSLQLDALIITGGNSLSHLDPEAIDLAPERDAFELALIAYMESKAIPTLGVCRGMQIINHYFLGHLVKVEDHIARNHAILPATQAIELPNEVNSFHGWTIPSDGLGKNLDALALDENGNIEAFIHKTKKIAGIMWHPERETPPNYLTLKFMKSILL